VPKENATISALNFPAGATDNTLVPVRVEGEASAGVCVSMRMSMWAFVQ
jgi:hypothetical protein